MVSQVSVMPKRSMLLLATMSDRAGALSHMERALTVPKWRPRTPGPASKRSKENSKSSWKPCHLVLQCDLMTVTLHPARAGFYVRVKCRFTPGYCSPKTMNRLPLYSQEPFFLFSFVHFSIMSK